MKKWISVIVILVLVGGGSYWFYNTRNAKASAPSTIIPTATVQKGTLESDVSGSGSLTPDIDEDITVTESNTIDTVEVKNGQHVKKGQTLLTYTDGTTLISPATGTLSNVSVYDGGRLNAGQTVAHITNYKNLDTVVQVDELDIPSVKKGQAATIIVNAYPDNTYKGKVTQIANEGTATNGDATFAVTVHLTSSKNLKAGMTATADIITHKKANVLYVPVEAIHKSGNQTYVLVDDGSSAASSQTNNNSGNSGQRNSYARWNRGGGYVTDNSNAHRVMVQTGINNDSDIEITSGLQEGQVVDLPPIVQGQSSSSSGSNGGSMFGGGGFGSARGFGGGYGGGFGGPRGNFQGSSGGFSRGGN